jgi:hypothetical protein
VNSTVPTLQAAEKLCFLKGAGFSPYIDRTITCMLARSVCSLTHVVTGKSMDAYV